MSSLTTEQRPAKTALAERFEIHIEDYVAAMEIAAPGKLGVLGTGDGRVIGVALETGREVFRQDAHRGGVLGISIAPDGAFFLSCGQDPIAKLWTSTGRLVRELPAGTAGWVEHVAWAPSGGRLATGAGSTVRVWSDAGEVLFEAEPLTSTVSALAWRADGTALAASCYGGVHLWPFVAGAKARHLAWKGSLISLAWSPDAKVIACGSQDGSVHFWRLATGQDSEMSGYAFKPRALAWDRESKLLATSGDAAATLWQFRGKGPEGTRPIRLEAHRGVITCLTFSPRTGVLASGSQDTSVLLWDPRRGARPIRYAFLEDQVTALVWHPESRGLLGADASGTVCFWEVDSKTTQR
jgi:WD40 repeat protein